MPEGHTIHRLAAGNREGAWSLAEVAPSSYLPKIATTLSVLSSQILLYSGNLPVVADGESATDARHRQHRALAPDMREHEPGIHVNIIEKDTRASSISIGTPIAITRGDPDFIALWLAEHRSSVSHLYQRIREIRGLNYGDYAYIEAFPGGMFSFFPDANRARRRQLFEIWIRPVLPDHAHMALRIAIHELRRGAVPGRLRVDP